MTRRRQADRSWLQAATVESCVLTACLLHSVPWVRWARYKYPTIFISRESVVHPTSSYLNFYYDQTIARGPGNEWLHVAVSFIHANQLSLPRLKSATTASRVSSAVTAETFILIFNWISSVNEWKLHVMNMLLLPLLSLQRLHFSHVFSMTNIGEQYIRCSYFRLNTKLKNFAFSELHLYYLRMMCLLF